MNKVNQQQVRRVIFLFSGSYLLAFVVYIFITRQPAVFNSSKTTGIVAFVNPIKYLWNTTLMERNVPVVEYVVGGEAYLYYDPEIDYKEEYEVGERVTMIYNNSNPKDSRIYKFITYWITTDEIIGFILILALVVSLIKVLYTPTMKQSNNFIL